MIAGCKHISTLYYTNKPGLKINNKHKKWILSELYNQDFYNYFKEYNVEFKTRKELKYYLQQYSQFQNFEIKLTGVSKTYYNYQGLAFCQADKKWFINYYHTNLQSYLDFYLENKKYPTKTQVKEINLKIEQIYHAYNTHTELIYVINNIINEIILKTR